MLAHVYFLQVWQALHHLTFSVAAEYKFYSYKIATTILILCNATVDPI